MGCCFSSPQTIPKEEEPKEDYPIPVIPVAAAHDASIFDSPFRTKNKEGEDSLLANEEKIQIIRPDDDDEDSTSSSVDQEMIKQLLCEVDASSSD